MEYATVFVCLVLSMHTALSSPFTGVTTPTSASSTTANSNTTNALITASSTINLSSTTSAYNQELLSPPPKNTYEVTENVIDIPDDRTLAPIIPNFTLVIPLNKANTSINKNDTNNTFDTGDETKLKKTSFTYIHFTKDPPEKASESGIGKLLQGLKKYVFGFKKIWIDSLHRHIHSYDGIEDTHKDKEDGFNEFLNSGNGRKYHKGNIHDEFYTNKDNENDKDFDDGHDEFEHEFGDY